MIARVQLQDRKGLGCNKLHYTGGELGSNTLQYPQAKAEEKEILFSCACVNTVNAYFTSVVLMSQV